MKKQHIFNHIKSLKRAILPCFFFFLVNFAIIYVFSKNIIAILIKPVNTYGLIFTGIMDGFLLKVNLSLYLSFILTIFFSIYQIYKFCKFGMKNSEIVLFRYLYFCSFILFFCGIIFAYFFIIPKAVQFFLEFFADLNMADLQLKILDYISFITSIMVCFSIAFQFPIIIFLLRLFGIISSKTITKYRKHAVVLIFIISAALTPPDILSQIAMAVPLILLMEISILVIKLYERKEKTC